MTLESLVKIAAGPGLAVLLLTFVEFSKIKINPWTALGKLLKKALGCLGRAANKDVLAKMDELAHAQQCAQTKLEHVETKLNEHIAADDRRDADSHRVKILQFNNELLRSIDHTKEEFIEALAEIDAYERFCKNHLDYPNNRAVLAIENIQENYKERLQKHDFLQEGTKED